MRCFLLKSWTVSRERCAGALKYKRVTSGAPHDLAASASSAGLHSSMCRQVSLPDSTDTGCSRALKQLGLRKPSVTCRTLGDVAEGVQQPFHASLHCEAYIGSFCKLTGDATEKIFYFCGEDKIG